MDPNGTRPAWDLTIPDRAILDRLRDELARFPESYDLTPETLVSRSDIEALDRVTGKPWQTRATDLARALLQPFRQPQVGDAVQLNAAIDLARGMGVVNSGTVVALAGTRRARTGHYRPEVGFLFNGAMHWLQVMDWSWPDLAVQQYLLERVEEENLVLDLGNLAETDASMLRSCLFNFEQGCIDLGKTVERGGLLPAEAGQVGMLGEKARRADQCLAPYFIPGTPQAAKDAARERGIRYAVPVRDGIYEFLHDLVNTRGAVETLLYHPDWMTWLKHARQLAQLLTP